jgi:2-polyprenyl-6-methoxyphenol hydroxylase-like FAD-dependent oxidoreductase
VTGFAQDDTGVDVRLSAGESARAQYLVGCDGGRSLIRKASGIEFPGWDPTRTNLIAEAEVTAAPPRGVRYDATGVHGLHSMEDGRTVRVIVTERQLTPDGEPTLRDLKRALVSVYGTDFGIHNPPATRVRGSFRYSAWSAPQAPCWFAQTAMSPGSGMEPIRGSPTR